MKTFITLTCFALAAIAATACTSNKTEEAPKPKSLVLYYSQTGTTKAVAEEIQRLTEADIEAIELAEPYEGDFGATIARVQKEKADNTLPALKPMKANIADYDIIYLGYSIWFGTYAPPIAALTAGLNLEGKKVVPFCTFGSGGLEVSVNDLKAKFPGADILDGYGVRTARITAMPAEVDRYLKENGLIEGEVDALPEFTEQKPVTDAERKVFDEACSDYQFPLGTPATFGTRKIGGTTEYKFAVKSKGMNGETAETTIYVIEKTENGKKAKAEFTKVVR